MFSIPHFPSRSRLLLGAGKLVLVTVVAAMLGVGVGCAQSVHVRTQVPAATMTLDDEPIGEVAEEGINVEIGAGMGPVDFSLEKNGKVFEGEILRTEVSLGIIATALVLTAVAAPTCVCLSCNLANPFAVAALGLGAITGLGFGGFTAAIASPSWLTLPFLAAGSALGVSPLLLLTLATRTPDRVVLGPAWRSKKKRKAANTTDGDDTNSTPTHPRSALNLEASEEMAW